MVKKILEGYMEKLHNLIRDEIRDFVQYALEVQEGTENEFYIFLSINTNQPKKYQISVDGENIKFTDVSIGKAKVIDEERLIKDLEMVAEDYIKLCNKAEIPTINPAIKKLLEVAKEFRSESPEEIRWLVSIAQDNSVIRLYFPRTLEQISGESLDNSLIIEFKRDEIRISTHGGNNTKSLFDRKSLTREKAKPIFVEFLKDLIKKMNNSNK